MLELGIAWDCCSHLPGVAKAYGEPYLKSYVLTSLEERFPVETIGAMLSDANNAY